jgi:LPS-assembly lipoprotein
VTLAAGCGLRPMYFPGNGESSVPEFALIRVEAIATRTGQILRNSLLDRLTPQGESAIPRYKLHAKIAIQSVSLAIQPDASITRFNLLLKVQFELTDIDTGEVVYRDSMRSVGSYNAVRSDYATLIAEQDTARRSAVSASEEIAALLAVFFARRSTLDD